MLVVVASVVALLSALNIWVERQVLQTDNFTDTSTKLIQNDEIRGALSIYLVDRLYQNVDVAQALQRRLPPQAKGLAAPLADALQPVLTRRADRLLARPKVQQLWANATRRAHQLFIAVLDGKKQILVTSGGNVVLDLRPILAQVEQRTGIGSRLQERLPPNAGQIVVMKGNQLDTVRKIVKVIRALSYFLFFAALALYAAAVFVARGRRRSLVLGTGVSLLVVGLIILIVRRFVGNYLVDTLTMNPDYKGAVGEAWTIGTNLLRNIGINTVVYGVGIVFAAWIAGPTRAARWVRRVLAPTMRNRPILIYGAVTLILLIVLLTGPTDAQRVYPFIILYLFALFGTEVLRRQTMREFPVVADTRPAPG
jgi:hypothetical protein